MPPRVKSTRRLGAEDSATRTALLDATERVILEDGYLAVSARSIAARGGLKPQLVHYYFRTMDDLLREVFQRISQRRFDRYADALSARPTLRTIWELNSDASETALVMEFTALANHRESIRAQIARAAERIRILQSDTIARMLKANGIETKDYPAIGISMLMVAVSRNLALEQTLGISGGHAEVLEIMERFLGKFDGPQRTHRSAKPPIRRRP